MGKHRDPKPSRERAGPRKGSRYPTRELARTWLITVINPVLLALRRERSWLALKNWSWRYTTGTFEYLWSTEFYVDLVYRDNFLEFRAWYPKVGGAMRVHDAGLSELAAACNVLFQRLWEVDDFRAAVQEADAMAARLGISIEDARGAVPAQKWPSLLGEYLINNVRSLPEHYTTALYWRQAAPTILRVRGAKSLAQDFSTLEEIGERVLRAAESAESSLVAVRQEYTKRFGLPPVPLPGPTDAREA